MASYVKFEDITFYNLSVYHYNFKYKRDLYNHWMRQIQNMNEFDKIFKQATKNIVHEFYHLPVAGKEDPIYRERVYCYELYHQLRLIWPPETKYTLSGEVDKSGHPLILNNGLDNKIPDFVVHEPGTMTNYLVVEVKKITAKPKDILKDLKTLTAFVRHGKYKRAILLFYGLDEGCGKIRKIVNKIEDYDERENSVQLDLIELWHHPAPKTSVEKINF